MTKNIDQIILELQEGLREATKDFLGKKITTEEIDWLKEKIGESYTHGFINTISSQLVVHINEETPDTVKVTYPLPHSLLVGLADQLKDWTDFDGAAYEVGRLLGLYSATFLKVKHVFWTDNPTGNFLYAILDTLVQAGYIEADRENDQYKWIV